MNVLPEKEVIITVTKNFTKIIRGGITGNKKIISNNISTNNNNPQEQMNYKDKHEEYFFENYNDSYSIESNHNTNSLLPYNDLNYYITDE